ncbi:BMP family ABC transporter substrate-binding protein [Clostridium gasigenes]|uniref:BMP family ABC transporter substrate-binding protein n=1 Tax=Clostridium gasigenes TaxID=94869 RepID=UPI001C0C8791|nr:BMP family ABC transporter substrate-binding protein [Clostridium gasigenes]MBU3104353.1 BMP family ABC transporter substrate-binding protein [Clostridium gasigenes]
MKKSISILVLLNLVLLMTIGCTESRYKSEKIAIIFSSVGLGDKSYNDLCYEGVLRAQDELGIEFDYSEPKSPKEYENVIREYAESEEYVLIIAVESEQVDGVAKVSKDFPKQKFMISDSRATLPNVVSIYEKWTEQVFLNGTIAGLAMLSDVNNNSKENVAGVILGIESSQLREAAVAFESGVKYVNSDAKVISAVVNDFAAHSKAKEIALLLYSRGAIFIQHLAGSAGLGVFAAANEADKYAFGVDGNQNFYDSDHIVSTARRDINNILYEEIKDMKSGNWNPGVHEYAMKENVLQEAREGSSVELSDQIVQRVETIRNKIINKEIIIPLTANELEEWEINR